jgi:hypothetical protein
MTIMTNDKMMAQISGKDGFIAALDQSGGDGCKDFTEQRDLIEVARATAMIDAGRGERVRVPASGRASWDRRQARDNAYSGDAEMFRLMRTGPDPIASPYGLCPVASLTRRISAPTQAGVSRTGPRSSETSTRMSRLPRDRYGARRDFASAVGVGGHGDYRRNRAEATALALFHVSRVEPQI